MAITLPYPSLVFVPLDKLTAEEMNQIVANYTALANNTGLHFSKTDIDVGQIPTITGYDITNLYEVDISSIETGHRFVAITNINVLSTTEPAGCGLSYKLPWNPTGYTSSTSATVKSPITNSSVVLMLDTLKVAGQDKITLRASPNGGNTTVTRCLTYVIQVD